MKEGNELLKAIQQAPQVNKDALLYEIIDDYLWDIAAAAAYPEDKELQIDAEILKGLLTHYGFDNIL